MANEYCKSNVSSVVASSTSFIVRPEGDDTWVVGNIFVRHTSADASKTVTYYLKNNITGIQSAITGAVNIDTSLGTGIQVNGKIVLSYDIYLVVVVAASSSGTITLAYSAIKV